MRLRAADLRTDELLLELPAEGDATNDLLLGPSGGVTGVYEQDRSRIRLNQITADELSLKRIRWHLPGGVAESDGTTRLGGVRIDATIPLQRARREGQPSFVGDVDADSASIDRVTVEHDGLGVSVEELRLRGLRSHTDEEGRVEVSAQEANVGKLTLRRGSIEIVVTDVELPTGLAVRGRAVAFPHLRVGAVNVRLADFDELRRSNGAGAEPARASKSSDGNRLPGPLLRLLDVLHGKIDVDLRVDATVPVIGRRRATHHFRIPITEGTLDYHELERDLSTLEDAFIDFKLKKDRLILERDIPLLPFGGRTLLYWPLDDERDRRLAKDKRVRLSKLAEPRVPPPRIEEEVEDGQKGIVLRQLDFDALDVVLSIMPVALDLAGGTVELGSPGEPGLREMEVRGDVRYEPDRPIEHTELRITARDIRAALRDLRVGGNVLRSSALSVGVVEDVHLEFDGVKPCSVAATVRDLELQGLEIAPAA